MLSTQQKVELLAPAKSAAIGKAAISCGADAVYISAEKFGAREQAGNNLADIAALVSYAHLFYARVYVALNTLLTDDELAEAFSLIQELASIGIDGLIIQDFGLLELPLPPIPLFASTQMHNDSLEKILFLEKAGFSRVILPREMTLKEIAAIRSKTSLDLECFVHGSLCVAYSGQCYLSYAIGGRSANRGACAQPCRRVYSLVDGRGTVLVKDKHLLSLKDLNRSDSLEALIDAGVCSFKIEGRLKDIAYVKNTVGFYRKKLDRLLPGRKETKSSSGETTLGFTPDVHKTFNRGFTDFGLTHGDTCWSSHLTPKSLGEKIGKIASAGKGYFTLALSHDLGNGDGICFFDGRGTLRGSVINTVKGHRVYPDKTVGLAPGTVIYRNHNHAFIKSLSAKNSCERKIALSLTLSETADGFSLSARDEDGNSGIDAMPAAKQVAEKKTLAEETIQKQLSKMNDTIFTCRTLTHTLREIYFLPVSFLNALRRGTIARLLEERERNRPVAEIPVHANDVPYPSQTIDYRGNCLNQKAVAFYKRHGAQVVERAAESGLAMQDRFLMRSKYCLRRDTGLCHKEAGPLYLVDENGQKFRLEFDCEQCRMSVRS
ncbi:MAG: U32 family peptidase [Candidatus Omnitrophica bacterium]|nr:U32 family peptidase [Candidatus Omnitrophota bacterium]MDD5672089.1 U32 family peptidase [Candidatus Omnitrophota bacterium]